VLTRLRINHSSSYNTQLNSGYLTIENNIQLIIYVEVAAALL